MRTLSGEPLEVVSKPIRKFLAVQPSFRWTETTLSRRPGLHESNLGIGT